MTLVSRSEGFAANSEKEPAQYTAKYVSVTDESFGDWLVLRDDYMKRRQWDRESEFDRYDEDPRTAHILINNQAGEVILGMRLTPVDAGVGDEMLSWNMVKDSTIHQQVYEKMDSLPLPNQSPAWDLTRLVPGPGLIGGTMQFLEVAPILFKEGYKHCLDQGQENPSWFFAIDIATHRSLSNKSLPMTVLAQAKIGTDKHETLFGYVLPRPAEEDNSRVSEPLRIFRGWQ